MINSSVDFRVTDLSTKGTGDDAIRIVKANYAVPGFRAYSTFYFRFKGDLAYVWSTTYLDAFPQYSVILDSISNSVQIH